MRSSSDDELYAVQGRYLGPPGKTLPVHVRYVAIVIGVVYFVVLLFLRAQLRISFGGLTYLMLAMASVLATMATMRLVGPERPASAVLAMLWSEIGTPRPGSGRSHHAAPDPRQVHLRTTRPRPTARRRAPGGKR